MDAPSSVPLIKRKPLPQHISNGSLDHNAHHRINQTDDLHKSPVQTSPLGYGWKPFWIRRSVISAYCVCFGSMLAALEVTFRESNIHKGITTTDDSRYYLWTYGPTAIFTLLASLWSRVDFRVRQTAPYFNLHRKVPLPAAQTVLLDYISSSTLESIWKALRNADWTVALSGCIGLLHVLLIVLSTSLFTTAMVPFNQDHVLYQTSFEFNASTYIGESSVYPLNIYAYDAVKGHNLTWPWGMTSEHLFQTFSLVDEDGPPNAIQQVPVDVLQLNFNCKEAEYQIDRWQYSWQYLQNLSSTVMSIDDTPMQYNTTFTPGNCAFAEGWIPFIWGRLGEDGKVTNFMDFIVDKCPGTSANDLVLSLISGQLQQHGTPDPFPSTCLGDNQTSAVGCAPDAGMVTIELLNSRGWICKPFFSITSATATYNASTSSPEHDVQISISTDATVRNLTDNEIFAAIWDGVSGLDQSTLLYQSDTTLSVNFTLPRGTSDVEFNRYRRVLHRADGVSAAEFFDTDLILNITQDYIRETSLQAAHQTMIVPKNNTVTGKMIVNQKRLIVRVTPCRLVETTLAILMLLGALLIFLLPRTPVFPRDTGSLSGVLDIMKASPSFTKIFVGTGSMSMNKMDVIFKEPTFSSRLNPPRNYATNVSHSPRGSISTIHIHGIPPSKDQSSQQASSGIAWWRPATIAKIPKVCMFAIVIIVVIVVEVLLLISDRHQGLGYINIEDEQHLLWSLLPAAVLVAIAQYYQAFGAAYRLVAPHIYLRRGAGELITIRANYLSSTSIELLWTTFRHKLLILTLVSIQIIISGLLTIVVSGIWESSSGPFHQQVPLQQTSWFRDTGSDDTGELGNNTIVSLLVMEQNLTYPLWTYHDLVLASIQLTDQTAVPNNVSNGTSIQVRIPAIASKLDCTLYDETNTPDLIYTSNATGIIPYVADGGDAIIYGSWPGPAHCSAGQDPHNFGSNLGDKTAWTMKWPGISTGLNSSIYEYYTNFSSDGCPSLYFMWACQPNLDTSLTPNSTVTFLRALACYENFTQVDVDTTLILPDFKIDTANPPVPDETTRQMFSAPNVAIPYLNVPPIYSLFNEDYFGHLGRIYGFDYFALMNSSHQEQVVNAIMDSHVIMRAQQLNVVLREYLDESGGVARNGQLRNFTGTLIETQQHRLVQNAVSTHILSGMLLLILACAVTVTLTTDTKRVLPKVPCSIAATVSLLADSNLLREDDSGGVSDTKAGKGRARDRTIYRMGWFARSSDGQKVFTINKIDATCQPLAEDVEGANSATIKRRPKIFSGEKRSAFSEVTQIDPEV